MKRITGLGLFFFSIFIISANADTKQSYRHHEAHVHGDAVVNIVVESSQLLLEIETPAMNVLGFETAPTTDEQRDILAKAETLLSDASHAVRLNHGDCKLNNVNVNSPEFPPSGGHEGEGDPHEEHEHEQEGHSEFLVLYDFSCSAVQKLESVEIRLFDTFPGFKTINAQWIVDSRQGARELTPSDSSIKLR